MIPEMFQKIINEKNAEKSALDHQINICIAAGCGSVNSNAVKQALEETVRNKGLEKSCKVKGVGCQGLCSRGPLLTLYSKDKAPVIYQKITVNEVPKIVANLGKPPIKKYTCPGDLPFFTRQQKIVLENSGVIDPEDIRDYIAAGGYQSLNNVIESMHPEDVVKEVFISGLRGRGGGGYPTGLKWSTVTKVQGKGPKYVICNADEGDPGAFMDRSILESDPHRVLEGMLIAGYAIGSNKGYVYIRGEYPLAIKFLNKAIEQARLHNILGHGVLGSTFDFDIEIRIGAGAFVCGEETALIASIEGKRGQPRPRPPYPAEHGLWGRPTLINNVETYANVPNIIRNGGDWFAGIGTPNSKGTKVFALAGNVKNSGVVEVPMGISLREIIMEIGGGVENGEKCKAVQTGGPSGGCIPEALFDTRVDYESLKALGSIMGSGGMVVMDNRVSMVEIARFFMEFCMSESCGKCIPCRVGTAHIYRLLNKFMNGEATAADLKRLEDLCKVVKDNSLCGLGQAAPNPVLSTLRFFREDYLALIKEPETETASVD